MPTGEEIIGFANRWYKDMFDNSSLVSLDDSTKIHIPTAVLFVASKLDAFVDRGKDDMLASKDVEDILAVIDGRPELVSEVAASSSVIRQHIGKVFHSWLRRDDLEYAIHGYLRADAARAKLLMERLGSMARG